MCCLKNVVYNIILKWTFDGNLRTLHCGCQQYLVSLITADIGNNDSASKSMLAKSSQNREKTNRLLAFKGLSFKPFGTASRQNPPSCKP